MYHALLSNRYLSTRVIPFIAVAAVALCTALVIIVVSVMSGFVDMVRNAGKTLMGDVIVSNPLRGIPHYAELIDRLNELPEVDAATPVVDSWGLLKMPYPLGADKETEVVQVWGIDPATFSKVTAYDDALHWRTADDSLWRNALDAIAREMWEYEGPDGHRHFTPETIAAVEAMTGDITRRTLLALAPQENRAELLRTPDDQLRANLRSLLTRRVRDTDGVVVEEDEFAWDALWSREPLITNLDPVLESGRTLQVRKVEEEGTEDAIVLGIHVSRGNERRKDGKTYRIAIEGQLWMPWHQVTLTVLPVSARGSVLKPESRIFPVANEAQFGVFVIDDKRVFIPIGAAQEMLDLDPADYIPDPDDIDPDTMLPRSLGRTPAKTTMILVSAAEGVSAAALKASVESVYLSMREQMILAGEPFPLPSTDFGVMIKTWEEQNAQIIGPVEKERNLMRILFSIIYFVCAGLVLVIFWAIVYEKTKDIGILRSVGASRLGILWVFVRYGLVVGVVGSIIGLGIAYLVVRNINHIHNALGEPFPAVAWGAALAAAAMSLAATLWLCTRGRVLPVVSMSLVTIALCGAGAGLATHRGFLVWDPQVYYFTEIPSAIDFVNAVVTMLGAVVFSVIGALIPASRAADFDPVAALRYE